MFRAGSRRREEDGGPRLSPLLAGDGQFGAWKVEGREHSARESAVALPSTSPSCERPGRRRGTEGGKGGAEWEEVGPSAEAKDLLCLWGNLHLTR